jgi:hypothetical protein
MNLYFMLVYAFFYRLYISIIFYTKYAMGKIKLTKKVQPLDYDQKYQKYIKYYKEAADTDANANIGADLYDYDARKTLFAEEKNDTERLWKTRILYEFTERGNILFYYNPYKLSFEYYSDVQIIPYKILQYVAKKYVAMNRCRDFYIDMVERPQNKMIDILRKEEEAMKSKKMKVNDITKLVDKDLANKENVFESLKEHRIAIASSSGPKGPNGPFSGPNGPSSGPNGPLTKPTQVPETEPKEKPLEFANKYVRLGKISEFNITQKPPKKSIAQTNEMMFSSKPITKITDFFDDLEIEEENPFAPIGAEQASNKVLEPSAQPLAPSAHPEKITSYKMFKMAQSSL